MARMFPVGACTTRGASGDHTRILPPARPCAGNDRELAHLDVAQEYILSICVGRTYSKGYVVF